MWVVCGAIIIESIFVPFPFALVAFTVKLKVFAVVGVPVIAPVVALSVKPPGNVPSMLHVMGVSPVAASVRLYAVPTSPFGNDVVVMVGAVPVPPPPPPPVDAIVIESGFVPFPAALAALTVKVNVPAAVGVPDITPAPESVKPPGNEPLSLLHVMGASPVASSVRLYAVPTVPLGNDAVVTVGEPVGAIVIESSFVSFPFALVALTVKVDVPSASGVPDITPATESVKPPGKSPLSTLHVMGASPVASSVWLYSVPTVPLGNASVVIAGAVSVPFPPPPEQAVKVNPITATRAIVYKIRILADFVHWSLLRKLPF
jgi:hypothetical protein